MSCQIIICHHFPFPSDDYPIAVKQAYVLWFSTVAWLLPSLISAIFYYKVCSTVWKSRFWGSSDNLKAPAATPTKKAAEGEGNSLSRCICGVVSATFELLNFVESP